MNPVVRRAAETDAWIRSFHASAEAADGDASGGVRLVCLPHAGGSASYFHPFSAALSPHVDTFAVQYPGRQDRRAEPLVETVPELAERIFDVLEEWADDRPLALFGHSMGATLAFEVAVRMEERLGTSPAALFLSGRRAPSHFRTERVHTRDDEGILAELAAQGGTDMRLLRDPDVQAMVLPTVRNDYRAIETHRADPDAAVSCPVTVLTGDKDGKVTATEAAAWERHSRGAFALRTFPGGHFFLDDHRESVADLVRTALAGLSPRRP
ncbi:thioesterase II family protein [Streptomyces formicae]|uniref:Putative thioesterase n=1 Tax=Streptomyces formicae TaxID=1616117 RepID=A0A291QI93_9ACTN|nr:alpha/beta fold hydrolase [Streptomyces formicae]ATL31278.1 putative thioesterase [Streptomyces formicae]